MSTREERIAEMNRQEKAALERSPHYVYRCFDASGRLLYIGCTRDLNARLDVHRSSWTNPVSVALNMRMARYTSEGYPTKSAGRKAEREAIYNEAPLLNLHHQKAKRTPLERRALIDAYIEATRPAIDPDVAALMAELFGDVA